MAKKKRKRSGRSKKAGRIVETDLFGPVSHWLTENGYTVRSEVLDCDITAVKSDELVVVELKRNFTTSLLIQATARQRITDSVYVAIPRPRESPASKKWRGIRHLLRRLELGLIFVKVRRRKPTVQIVFHPVPFDRKKRGASRRAVIREMNGRSADFNHGGSSGVPLVTAYREQAIHIACCLERSGPLSPRELREQGTGPKTLSILYNDFYGWFERIDRGLYALRSGAEKELEKFGEVMKLYQRKAAATAPRSTASQ